MISIIVKTYYDLIEFQKIIGFQQHANLNYEYFQLKSLIKISMKQKSKQLKALVFTSTKEKAVNE